MTIASNLRIMVVDKGSVSRTLIVDALDQIGIRNVAIAKDGLSALKSLMLRPVHLVISDINLQGMDGMELLTHLRDFKPTANIGFILLTSCADKKLMERGRQLRLNRCVAKPFTVLAIKHAVEAVVGRLS